jgi:hypothetical protein
MTRNIDTHPSAYAQPEFIAEVTLFPVEGRKGPILPTNNSQYGCACLLARDSTDGPDCRILLEGQPLQLVEPRKVRLVFLSPDSADLFRDAGKFYLWEGRTIGEALVVANSY